MPKTKKIRTYSDPNVIVHTNGSGLMRFEYLKKEIDNASKKKILFLPHAVRQMSRIDRMITPDEVSRIILNGEIIEDYPNDSRGHSC